MDFRRVIGVQIIQGINIRSGDFGNPQGIEITLEYKGIAKTIRRHDQRHIDTGTGIGAVALQRLQVTTEALAVVIDSRCVGGVYGIDQSVIVILQGIKLIDHLIFICAICAYGGNE